MGLRDSFFMKLWKDCLVFLLPIIAESVGGDCFTISSPYLVPEEQERVLLCCLFYNAICNAVTRGMVELLLGGGAVVNQSQRRNGQDGVKGGEFNRDRPVGSNCNDQYYGARKSAWSSTIIIAREKSFLVWVVLLRFESGFDLSVNQIEGITYLILGDNPFPAVIILLFF